MKNTITRAQRLTALTLAAGLAASGAIAGITPALAAEDGIVETAEAAPETEALDAAPALVTQHLDLEVGATATVDVLTGATVGTGGAQWVSAQVGPVGSGLTIETPAGVTTGTFEVTVTALQPGTWAVPVTAWSWWPEAAADGVEATAELVVRISDPAVMPPTEEPPAPTLPADSAEDSDSPGLSPADSARLYGAGRFAIEQDARGPYPEGGGYSFGGGVSGLIGVQPTCGAATTARVVISAQHVSTGTDGVEHPWSLILGDGSTTTETLTGGVAALTAVGVDGSETPLVSFTVPGQTSATVRTAADLAAYVPGGVVHSKSDGFYVPGVEPEVYGTVSSGGAFTMHGENLPVPAETDMVRFTYTLAGETVVEEAEVIGADDACPPIADPIEVRVSVGETATVDLAEHIDLAAAPRLQSIELQVDPSTAATTGAALTGTELTVSPTAAGTFAAGYTATATGPYAPAEGWSSASAPITIVATATAASTAAVPDRTVELTVGERAHIDLLAGVTSSAALEELEFGANVVGDTAVFVDATGWQRDGRAVTVEPTTAGTFEVEVWAMTPDYLGHDAGTLRLAISEPVAAPEPTPGSVEPEAAPVAAPVETTPVADVIDPAEAPQAQPRFETGLPSESASTPARVGGAVAGLAVAGLTGLGLGLRRRWASR